MELGFNCSDLCDGSSSFGSQVPEQWALQELCTVTVVSMEVMSALGYEVCCRSGWKGWQGGKA